MTTKKLTKLLALYLPYILFGLVATNFGEAWRLAEGKELGDKIMAMIRQLCCEKQRSCRFLFHIRILCYQSAFPAVKSARRW